MFTTISLNIGYRLKMNNEHATFLVLLEPLSICGVIKFFNYKQIVPPEAGA